MDVSLIDTSIPANTTIYQYDRMGRPADQLDSLGKKIITTYNYEGRQLAQTEQKEGRTQIIIVSNAYDKNGNLA